MFVKNIFERGSGPPILNWTSLHFKILLLRGDCSCGAGSVPHKVRSITRKKIANKKQTSTTLTLDVFGYLH